MPTGIVRIVVGLLLVLLLSGSYTPAAGGAAQPGAGELRIGVIGDQTGAADLDAAYAVLQQGVQALQAQDVAVVLHVGDMLESSAAPDQVRAQYARATAMLDQLGAPWFMTPGDHDVNPPQYEPDSPDRSREALFQELYGARVPQVREHPYYSFDAAGYHFIALYAHETLHADPRWGDIFMARISDAQLGWLAADLQQNRAEPTVVFIHQPLWYHWSGWARVHQLLRQYPVAAVIAGHFHYDQDEGEIDGIRYLTVGATGGMVKQGHRDAGAVQHVSVVRVQSSRYGHGTREEQTDQTEGAIAWGRSRPQVAGVQLIPVDGGGPLGLTPRADMDRAQAIDIVLGELYSFAQQNPVYLQDGRLVRSCADSQPASVAITPIGNPIDLPMTVSVAFTSDSEQIALSEPGFLPGQCQAEPGGSGCVLKRGARVWVSNLSSVTVNPYAGPLWQTGLALAGGAPPPVGAALNFDVRLSFPGQQGELFLERRATTRLLACGPDAQAAPPAPAPAAAAPQP